VSTSTAEPTAAPSIETTAPTTSRRRLAWGLFLFGAAAVTVGSILLLVYLADGSLSITEVIGQFALLPPAAAFSIVGLVVTLRQPQNACGWLMLAIGTIWSLGVSPPTPDGTIGWALSWGWVPAFGLMATHLPLRLPNGRLPSPRWRWVSRVSTVAMVVLGVGILFSPETPDNPVANEQLAMIGVVGLIGLAICAALSIASLFVRARHSTADERRQIRWIAVGAVVFISTWLLGILAQPLGVSPETDTVISSIVLFFYAAIPVSIGIAILKYRLYDIDVVIKKTLVVAVLAAFFVLVYALVVGGIGALVEGSSNSALSFAAAAIVAALFQPVLARARRFADRFVYGKRATPYEVLATFGEHLADTYAADDVLPRTARVLAEGVGADRARVWLTDGEGFRQVAEYPVDADPERPDDHRAEVRHRGDLLGALSVAMPANDPMDPGKEKLIADLAAQAGLVLRNVRLVEDLRSSRRRLVAAQDEERRKLERNIHDGAQQQLVALAVKARLTRTLTERDPAKAAQMLMQIETETQSALEDLRDLARGIYPPLLADKGLEAALTAQARKSPLPVTVTGDGIGRFPQEVEAAIYFSVLEALQNIAKYAEAQHAEIRLARDADALTFEVHDDGRGFDAGATGYGTGLRGMADRLAALDGDVSVTSRPGEGTTVDGRIPVGARVVR
jgi:signal transduction histidine kinase